MRNRPSFTCCNKAIFHLDKDEKACLPSSAFASPFVAVSTVMNHVCFSTKLEEPFEA